MLNKNVLFILQVPDISSIPLAVLLKVVNFFVKVDKLTILIFLLHLKVAKFPILADLILESSASVIYGLIDTLSDAINVINLLF